MSLNYEELESYVISENKQIYKSGDFLDAPKDLAFLSTVLIGLKKLSSIFRSDLIFSELKTFLLNPTHNNKKVFLKICLAFSHQIFLQQMART